ncbi:hypothetical protein LOZ12_002160 [Ophidiomyces ophidiicola]|uniref:Uncharacterized protein n=1 Tax=Ophidiomyces ophidiicola TaxID=1387563 RepID=A0ACB8UYC6_9EURO|nr:uncharacterized protein LOZ57_004915 [Ophidiomyces ophidiicola]KAI1912118.1 hypothetical protein LOZ61_003468 [Ophidiomyces ophidiicola]KAI1921775.1 hypothetical protein LOZ64_001396 [Ophidiomyces ophidiicola]KAI1925405.1 hypothetical protein LOZ60_004210 [Ophidiomyces ophidiicola]KAI1944239.1 hypothetical protein LOZ57_004915 [Ophidiomyces ophidiicola]KAI1949349.1 hypothetical protein LOZ62_002313 [Ophidiomyces ophidiicola]
MGFFKRFRKQAQGSWQGLPLPPLDQDTTPIFQTWHEFTPPGNKWAALDLKFPSAALSDSRVEAAIALDSPLGLVTWNVDSSCNAPDTRISAIISHIQGLASPVDIIFLQEVSHPALLTLLSIPWLRDQWFSSEADLTRFGKQPFISLTFLSKLRFGVPNSSSNKITLGPVWRVKYQSRFGRDALCCDILLQNQLRIRLINVHLDSLQITPSMRPRQLSVVASYLRATGHGLIGGDFNPVLPGDDDLVSSNGLVDVWSRIYPNKPGFTWGIDGKQRFPPHRLDKVVVVGLQSIGISILPPGTCMSKNRCELSQVLQNSKEGHHAELLVPWSDHCGLLYSFVVVNTQ